MPFDAACPITAATLLRAIPQYANRYAILSRNDSHLNYSVLFDMKKMTTKTTNDENDDYNERRQRSSNSNNNDNGKTSYRQLLRALALTPLTYDKRENRTPSSAVKVHAKKRREKQQTRSSLVTLA